VSECGKISVKIGRKESNMTREILICRKGVECRTRSEENKKVELRMVLAEIDRW